MRRTSCAKYTNWSFSCDDQGCCRAGSSSRDARGEVQSDCDKLADFCGHEISEEINVLEAALKRWLKLDKGPFIGRDALIADADAGGPKRKIVGLEMVERGIGRDGYPVLSLSGEEIGRVTSGSPAPFLKQISMAL